MKPGADVSPQELPIIADVGGHTFSLEFFPFEYRYTLADQTSYIGEAFPKGRRCTGCLGRKDNFAQLFADLAM